MLTMQKEKVNTHFSFPMKLDMSGYVEKSLLPQQYQESKSEQNEEMRMDEEAGANEQNDEKMDTNSSDDGVNDQYEYSLIGVTVHTGNADGGHYYSFIKERNGPHPHAPDRWFLFNDAEVKQFDPSQIEAECFGGEMTSKTYDTVTEKYLDFSFEKTNSAYMLFYERIPTHPSHSEVHSDQGSLDENIRNDDSYEQASCSTTTPMTTNKVSDFSRMTEPAATVSSIEVKTNTESPDAEAPTDSMSDELAVEHKKCDIDTKGGSDSNENADKPLDANKVTVLMHALKKSPSRNLLNKELEEWIWEDNRYFLQDRNIFEHTYFK